jgi:hypothetical protein
MIIRLLSELTAPDEPALRFTPLGFSTGGTMRPEDAAEHHQQTIAHADLAPDVPEDTRRSFERLRTIHSYGVLCYDLYTAVDTLSLLVLEYALAERFLDYYGGTIPFVDKTGAERPLSVTRFEQVYDALHKGGSHAKGGWRLQLRRKPEQMEFEATMAHLMEWARREALLRGQRNRHLERVLVKHRNLAAHPTGYQLVSPVNSARAIRDVAEIINHLWGARTPGGRLYPAPIRREIIAIGWRPRGGPIMFTLADNLRADDVPDDGIYLLVRAVVSDHDLGRFDAQHETTAFPSEYLWGSGSRPEALAWLARQRPVTDKVECLDRWLLIRRHEGGLDLPRRPEVAAGLGEYERRGDWYLVCADFPNDAFTHVRQVGAEGSSCSLSGPCEQCAVETIGTGSWREVMDLLQASGVTVSGIAMPDVRAPTLWPRSREVG